MPTNQNAVAQECGDVIEVHVSTADCHSLLGDSGDHLPEKFSFVCGTAATILQPQWTLYVLTLIPTHMYHYMYVHTHMYYYMYMFMFIVSFLM